MFPECTFCQQDGLNTRQESLSVAAEKSQRDKIVRGEEDEESIDKDLQKAKAGHKPYNVKYYEDYFDKKSKMAKEALIQRKSWGKKELKMKVHLVKTLHETAGPDWFQDLSNFQKEVVDMLPGAIDLDRQQGKVTGTQKALYNIGIFPFVSPKILEPCLKSCDNDPIRFLFSVHKEIVKIESEDYEKEYFQAKTLGKKISHFSLNERLVLSAVFHLYFPTMLRKLDEILPPPYKKPKIIWAKKPPKPKSKKYSSPYLEPLPINEKCWYEEQAENDLEKKILREIYLRKEAEKREEIKKQMDVEEREKKFNDITDNLVLRAHTYEIKRMLNPTLSNEVIAPLDLVKPKREAKQKIIDRMFPPELEEPKKPERFTTGDKRLDKILRMQQYSQKEEMKYNMARQNFQEKIEYFDNKYKELELLEAMKIIREEEESEASEEEEEESEFNIFVCKTNMKSVHEEQSVTEKVDEELEIEEIDEAEEEEDDDDDDDGDDEDKNELVDDEQTLSELIAKKKQDNEILEILELIEDEKFIDEVDEVKMSLDENLLESAVGIKNEEELTETMIYEDDCVEESELEMAVYHQPSDLDKDILADEQETTDMMSLSMTMASPDTKKYKKSSQQTLNSIRGKLQESWCHEVNQFWQDDAMPIVEILGEEEMKSFSIGEEVEEESEGVVESPTINILDILKYFKIQMKRETLIKPPNMIMNKMFYQRLLNILDYIHAIPLEMYKHQLERKFMRTNKKESNHKLKKETTNDDEKDEDEETNSSESFAAVKGVDSKESTVMHKMKAANTAVSNKKKEPKNNEEKDRNLEEEEYDEELGEEEDGKGRKAINDEYKLEDELDPLIDYIVTDEIKVMVMEVLKAKEEGEDIEEYETMMKNIDKKIKAFLKAEAMGFIEKYSKNEIGLSQKGKAFDSKDPEKLVINIFDSEELEIQIEEPEVIKVEADEEEMEVEEYVETDEELQVYEEKSSEWKTGKQLKKYEPGTFLTNGYTDFQLDIDPNTGKIFEEVLDEEDEYALQKDLDDEKRKIAIDWLQDKISCKSSEVFQPDKAFIECERAKVKAAEPPLNMDESSEDGDEEGGSKKKKIVKKENGKEDKECQFSHKPLLVECIDQECGLVGEDEVPMNEFLLARKMLASIPAEERLEAAVKYLADKGDPLAILPEIYRVPWLTRWYEERRGIKVSLTENDKQNLMSVSLKQWATPYVNVTTVPIKIIEKTNLTWDNVEWARKKSAQLLEKYHYAVKSVLVTNDRNYFPTMFTEYHKNPFMRRFRDMFFTYLPGRPNDAFTIHPYAPSKEK